MTTSRAPFLTAALALCLAAAVQGQTASLVRDINPGEGVVSGSSPGGFQTALGKVFFTAFGIGSGAELWVTDGTDKGTRLVRDLCPGLCNSYPDIVGTLSGALLFTTFPDQGEALLWRTDGTPAGTVALTGPVFPRITEQKVAHLLFAGHLYFPGCEGGECGLWKTDGTTTGTRLVKSTDFFPTRLVAAGDRIAFMAGGRLWMTDGTTEGTTRLDVFGEDAVQTMAYVAGKLFLVTGGIHGSSLWVSNGTGPGTRLLKVLSRDSYLNAWLKPGANGVYFPSDEGRESLWYSDGTTGGTRTLPVPILRTSRDLEEIGGTLVYFTLEAGSSIASFWALASGSPEPRRLLSPSALAEPFLVRTGERVVFLVLADHRQLWSTDGTVAGTGQVTDLCAGSRGCGGVHGYPSVWQGALLMVANDGRNGDELWRTDGTATGTQRLTGLPPGQLLQDDDPWAATLDGKLFFAAGPPYGQEVWVSEGPAATHKVTEIVGGGAGSDLDGLLAAGDQLFFHACDGVLNTVWRSTGDEPGTVSLGPASGGACNFYEEPDELATAAGQVFFHKEDGTLWRTDGTEAGTHRLSLPADHLVNPGIAVFQDRLFFSVWTEDGVSLWKTDGTPAGTAEVLEIPAGLGSPQFLTAVGSELYFVTEIASSGMEVWRSDGTPAGTRSLASLEGTYYGAVPGFVRMGSLVYFVDALGRSLWRTDGTAAGTAPVETAGDAYYLPARLTVHQGVLYFLASSPSNQRGLWRTDGSSGGTVPVRLFPDPHPSLFHVPSFLVSLGGQLFFDADDGVHGIELWKSDGTSAGTTLVRDVFPGPGSARPSSLVSAGGRLFFAALDGTHGVELWQSDGTEAGTRLVEDIVSMGSSYPEKLTPAGSRLFFTADDGFTGRELWVLPLGEAGCQPSARNLCLGGGRFRVAAEWKDFQGNTGHGMAVAVTSDTGYFWFFDPANVEVILKVLDGTGVNGHRWVFYGALSSVEYTLTVTDTQTGLTRRYFNPAGQLASVGDTTSFGPLGAYSTKDGSVSVAAPSPAVLAQESTDPAAATGSCQTSAERLCLSGQRFAVEASWKDFQGNTGAGKAVALTGDTGYFWFFDAANVEVVLKVLDGTPLNGKHWVFYGALSSVEYTITVTDTQTGKKKTYKNPSGQLASVADTGAF